MWHEENHFECVGETTAEFLQWLVRERSDHLEGCPWEVFVTDQACSEGDMA